MTSKFESEVQVRPSDIDAHQHVHNSKYLDYVLTARFDQIREYYKIPIEEYEKHGWTWVIRSLEIEYRRPLVLGDTALVRTWVIGIGNKKGGRRARSLANIGFEIANAGSGKLAAKGSIIYVMIDVNTGRPVEIPDWVIEKHNI